MKLAVLESHRPAWAALVVAAITFLTFGPCLVAQFVGLDDTNLIVNNAHFRGFTWEHLRWMFAGSLNIGVYIPLSWMSLALDYVFWGMKPFGYHLTNLLLHSINAALVYVLMDALYGHRRWVALFAALFFAIHPLRVESVAWVVERRDVLSGTFFFLTLLSYLGYVRAQENSEKRWRYGLTFAFYILLLFFISL